MNDETGAALPHGRGSSSWSRHLMAAVGSFEITLCSA